MKVDSKIKEVFETRRGTSERGNWCLTDVHLAFNYTEAGCKPQDHEVIATISGEPNNDRINYAISHDETVTVTLYFNVRKSQKDGRQYNNVRVFLPKDYML